MITASGEESRFSEIRCFMPMQVASALGVMEIRENLHSVSTLLCSRLLAEKQMG